MDPDWDVIVIGAGTAGIPTALFAADRGARVMLVEAAPQIGGTLHWSSGSIAAAGGERQARLGVEDSPARHFADSMRINHGTGVHSKLRLWQDHALDALNWLLDEGLPMGSDQPQFNPAHEPYDVPRIYTPADGGRSYVTVLQRLLDERIASGRIELKLDTRLLDFLSTDQGVTGIRVSHGGETSEYRGRNIVLATGGYVNNADYWKDLHGLPKRTYGSPYSRGDGITAARRLGAKIAHADQFLPTVGGTRDIDEVDKFWVHTRNSPVFRTPWEIAVNLDGRRFMAEDRPGPDRRERLLQAQPDMAFWMIYDEAIRQQSSPFFLWPDDKVRRAFDEHEDFQMAGSLAELAQQCALDPRQLALTVARYNAGQAVGSDEFGREHLPLPITQPPFYAVKHHGIAVISFGGLDTDDRFGVLREDGSPVQNLYAVGEILGAGMFGNAYLGGMMVGGAVTFGRLLGKDILTW